jgi:hypothetical protein
MQLLKLARSLALVVYKPVCQAGQTNPWHCQLLDGVPLDPFSPALLVNFYTNHFNYGEKYRHTNFVLWIACRYVRRMLQPVQTEPLQEPHDMPQIKASEMIVCENGLI